MFKRTPIFFSLLLVAACGTEGELDFAEGAVVESAVAAPANKSGCTLGNGGRGGSSDGGTEDPEYIENKGMLCVVTSEVNWKIGEGLIEGGATAEALRDCIGECLEDIDDGQGGKCQEANGFTNNDKCWKALAQCEVDCGGPEVDVGCTELEAQSLNSF